MIVLSIRIDINKCQTCLNNYTSKTIELLESRESQDRVNRQLDGWLEYCREDLGNTSLQLGHLGSQLQRA